MRVFLRPVELITALRRLGSIPKRFVSPHWLFQTPAFAGKRITTGQALYTIVDIFMRSGKHQRSKQRSQHLCWKVHDRAQSFVLCVSNVTKTFLIILIIIIIIIIIINSYSSSPNGVLWTFRSEDEDDYEYEFSVLSMRIRFGGRHFRKCACSAQKTRTHSRPRPSI